MEIDSVPEAGIGAALHSVLENHCSVVLSRLLPSHTSMGLMV